MSATYRLRDGRTVHDLGGGYRVWTYGVVLAGGARLAVAESPRMSIAFEAPSVDSAAGQARAQIAKWRAA